MAAIAGLDPVRDTQVSAQAQYRPQQEVGGGGYNGAPETSVDVQGKPNPLAPNKYQQWFSPGNTAAGGYMPNQGRTTGNPNQNTNTGTGPATPNPNAGENALIQPTYLSQLFPQGIPQGAVQTAGTNYDPTSFLNQISRGMQPAFNQQDKALQDALANAGIVGGSTGGAVIDLSGQQQHQLQDQSEAALMQLKQAQGQQDQFNAQSGNAMNQFNIGNRISSGQFDIENNLQAQEQLAQIRQQQWSQKLAEQTQMQLAGMQGQTGAFNPIYQQPQVSDNSAAFGGLGGALAANMNAYTPKATISGPTIGAAGKG